MVERKKNKKKKICADYVSEMKVKEANSKTKQHRNVVEKKRDNVKIDE